MRRCLNRRWQRRISRGVTPFRSLGYPRTRQSCSAGAPATPQLPELPGIVRSCRSNFVSGKALRASKVQAAPRKAAFSVVAEERPLWFPGSTAPEWLDGR